MATVFLSYSHIDENYRKKLDVQLALLKQQGGIDAWDDHQIEPGGDIDEHVREKLDKADIILLLISPDFINSKYAFGVEQKRAMQRHRDGTAVVIPVILRAADWSSTDFGWLKALPRDGKPIKTWTDKDVAYADVTKGIERVAKRINKAKNLYNINPATCLPDADFGRRKYALRPGTISFMKWRDPGGPGYQEGLPYDRANRVLAAYNVRQGVGLFNESYLMATPDVAENWLKHAHVWLHIASDIPMCGDLGPGVLFRRIDALSLESKTLVNGVRSLEYFVPDDPPPDTVANERYIYMRWLELPIGHDIFASGPIAYPTPFIKAFLIQKSIQEPEDPDKEW